MILLFGYLTADSIEGKFTFTVTAAEGVPMPEVVSYTTPDTDGGTVTFGAITYTAPGTYEYTITETGAAPGVTNDPVAAKTVTVMVVDNGDGSLAATVDHTEANPLTFINKYDVGHVAISLPVKKELVIPEGLTGPASIKEAYTFTLMAENGVPMPEVTVLKNPDDNGGVATYGPIEFTDPGTYEYLVTESGTVPGVTNDPVAAKKITVTVTDDGNGALIATATSTSENPLTFSNTYVADGSHVLKAVKNIEGRTFKPGDSFTFLVNAKDGAPLPKDAEGNEVNTVTITPEEGVKTEFLFGEFAFTAADTGKNYVYELTEVAENLSGMTYDTEPRVITITVTDDGQGGLLVQQSEELVWTNVYVRPIVEIFIHKIWDDEDRLPTRPKEVTVYLKCEENPEYNRSYVLKAENNWKLTIKNLPGDYTYTLEEEVPAKFWAEITQDGLSFKIVNHLIPATGDDNRIELWAIIALVSVAGIALIAGKKKKNS